MSTVADIVAYDQQLARLPLQSHQFQIQGEDLFVQDRLLTKPSLSRLFSMLGVPSHFHTKCSPNLTRTILSEFLEKQERSLDILHHNSEGIISFLWGDAVTFQITQLLSTLQAVLPMGMKVTKISHDLTQFSIFITDESAFNIIGSDEIFFGVSVRYSFDASSPLKVSYCFFRPTCTNGAYIPESSFTLPRRLIREPNAALLAIGEGASQIFHNHQIGAYSPWQDNIREMARKEITDPMMEIAHLTRRMGVSPHLADKILEAYTEEAISTEWGLVNAFTRAANSIDEVSLAESLWGFAGTIVHEGSVPCKVCGHIPL